MDTSGDIVNLEADAFHASILDRPLDFPPPYVDKTDYPGGFTYWWRLLQYVYRLPAPTQFPPLPAPLTLGPEERRVLDRYIRTCGELAESSVLSHRVRLRFSFGAQGSNPRVETDFPANEALRGTTVLFRQVSSGDEPASYTKVRKIIGRHVHEASDADSERRSNEQRAWNAAHARLQAGLLIPQADRLASVEMGFKVPPGGLAGEEARPQQLISMFQYGDLIHWGRHSEDLEGLMQDDFLHRWTTLQFIETLIQLSHFYLGYSIVVRNALGHSTP